MTTISHGCPSWNRTPEHASAVRELMRLTGAEPNRAERKNVVTSHFIRPSICLPNYNASLSTYRNEVSHVSKHSGGDSCNRNDLCCRPGGRRGGNPCRP